MATNPANIYCAPNDIVDILSQAGVDLRSDDAPPTLYGGAAAKAGNRIDLYCFRRYTPDNLAQSDLVKDWAATLAAYYLCIRRGNPPPQGVAIMFENAIADLTEIKKGLSEIPGIPARKSYAPVLSKMRSTLRPYPRAVVETSQSSTAGGLPANYHQHQDVWDRFGMNTNAILDMTM
jgi:hypothetical protein